MAYDVGGFRFDDEMSAREAFKESKAVAKIKSSMDMQDANSVLRVYKQAIEKDIFHTKVGLAFLQECQDIIKSQGADSKAVPPIKFVATDIEDEELPNEPTQETSVKEAPVKKAPAPRKAPAVVSQGTAANRNPVKPKRNESASLKNVKTGAHTRVFKTEATPAKHKRYLAGPIEKSTVNAPATIEEYAKSLEQVNAKVIKINKILLILCIVLGLIIIGMFAINTTINSPNILNYENRVIDKYSSWEQELNAKEQVLDNLMKSQN